MQKFWKWLTLSSANPQAIALTVKGILTTFIPLVLIAGKYFGLNAGELGTLPDQLESLVIAVLGIVGAVMTVLGLTRKVWNTLSPKKPTP